MAEISSPFRFGPIIRAAREAQGLTLPALAECSGLSAHATWEAEARGGGRMSTIAALLDALDVRLAGLPRGRSLGTRLRILRERRGWTVLHLATRAEVSVNAVRRAEEDGATAATVEALLAILAPTVRARKPERARWEGGRRDCRWTPPEFFDAIERVVGVIDLDPCGDTGSPVRARTIYTEDDDGLTQPWFGTVYCNPPYSGATAFLRRSHEHWTAGGCRVLALLLPVQTQLAAFHDLVAGVADVFLLRDRIRFIAPDGRREKAPFPSMVVIYGADEAMVTRFLDEFACIHLARSARKSGGARALASSSDLLG